MDRYFKKVADLIEGLIQEFGIDDVERPKAPVSQGLAKGIIKGELPEISFTDDFRSETPEKGFKRYIASIVSSLEAKGIEQDIAMEAVIKAISEFQKDGLLPEFPKTESGEEMDNWLNSAASSNFAHIIVGKF